MIAGTQRTVQDLGRCAVATRFPRTGTYMFFSSAQEETFATVREAKEWASNG
jgi:hypothetical protein